MNHLVMVLPRDFSAEGFDANVTQKPNRAVAPLNVLEQIAFQAGSVAASLAEPSLFVLIPG